MRTTRLLTCSFGFLALAPLAHGQVTAAATANATVQPAGPRTGTNGTNFLNIEGSANGTNGSLASFGVLDFAANAFNPGGQTASGISGNQLTLSLTESNAAFTMPATLNFYLTTNTSVSLSNVTGATYSPLRFDSANAAANPYGVDAQLGTLGNGLFSLGTGAFTTTGNPAGSLGMVDRYTLTLSGGAISAFLAQLNSPTGTFRLVISSTEPTGAATLGGATNATTTLRPTLSFSPTFATANGLYRQSTAGSWTPTGGAEWANAATGPGTAGWDNSGTATAYFTKAPTGAITINAGNINAAGLQFDVSGYTVASATAADTLTLTGAHFLTVTNAADTATISAPVAGTAGLAKLGAGTLALTAANTFTGNINLLAGTLAVTADNNLGNTANAVTLAGGTLRATGNLALNANRGLSGTGGLDVAAGNTLTINGVVNAGAVTLANAGTVALTNTAGLAGGANASNTLGSVTFNAAGAILSAPPNGAIPGVTQIGGVTVAAGVTSGTVAINSNIYVAAGSTNTFNVAATGATLAINGGIAGNGVLVQSGPGTLILNGDNSNLTGTGATPASFRQGGGGTVVIPATNPAPNAALGTAQIQANGGTLLNNTGAAIILPNSVSLGASTSAAAPGGFTVAGNNAAATVSVAGNVSLFGTVARTLTANTPTAFTGLLSQVAGTTGASLVLAGSSTITFNGTAGVNDLAVPVTLATTGTGGVIASKVGAFGSVPTLTLANTALLTIDAGAASGAGATDALNDNGVLSLMANGGAFGRIALTLANARETVGGLQLGAADTFTLAAGGTVVLPAGLVPAGTYGAIGSGAQFQNNDYFAAGGGQLLNSATAVPEPSTWLLMLLGTGSVVAARRRGQRV